ncbi:MAG: HD domain-containing protein [Halobacteria archaeon]|nr:HD domain-containing protein [Halobacteria archaeon]
MTGKFETVRRIVDDDDEIEGYLEAQNTTAVKRLGYNDHGRKHIGIVQERALELLELLAGDSNHDGVGLGVEEHKKGLGYEDAKVVVYLAATLHDVGHVVHRDRHPYYSVDLADGIVDRILGEADVYTEKQKIAVKGDVLHAILCHHTEESPLTAEAGIVRVADALDMEMGRSRLPYEKGRRGIDTVSSQAVKEVRLLDGRDEHGVPVLIEIDLRNSAGIYQVDSLLRSKVEDSGIKNQIRIVAVNEGDDIVGKIEF